MLLALERINEMPSVAVGEAQIGKMLKMFKVDCELLQANKSPKAQRTSATEWILG